MKKIIIPITIIILGLVIFFAYQQEWFKSKEQKNIICNKTCEENYNKGIDELKKDSFIGKERKDELLKSQSLCQNECVEKYK